MSGYLPENYLEQVYAGWLGKVIGVRYGAPVEMWSSEAIEAFYGELNGYVKEYHDFAADDDTNGPLFFIRALEDYEAGEGLTPEQIGDTVLNYVPYGHGFFWWGGYGMSAEHTLFENLTKGIKAPQSGSKEQNGILVAEQIGGQIFIDSWGLVFPGDYRKAAFYAQKAASVGWDENGIYGGMFVAACVSAAFTDKNVRSVLEKGLSVIPGDCTYRQMAQDLTAFYGEHPEDWKACLAYVKAHYWMDNYQGWCHIIPNAAIIVLAMLYGEGDFTKTLNIGNMCGFDTDCNVGNLGAIMGVLVGLDGIDFQKWRADINDFQACSSVVGSLNITDAASSAVYLAKLGCLAAGQPLPEEIRELTKASHQYHFELPGSTQSVRVEVIPDRKENGRIAVRNTDEASRTGSRSLKVMASPFSDFDGMKVFVKTYYAKEDFSDGRYQPSFSPILYPGQTLSACVRACGADQRLNASLFVLDYHTGQMHFSPSQPCGGTDWTQLTWQIPGGNDWCIKEAGVYITRAKTEPLPKNDPGTVGIFLDNLQWDGSPDYTVNFAKEKNWEWEPKPVKLLLSQFTKNKGIWSIEEGSLRAHCVDWAETYTGDVVWKDYRLSVSLTPLAGSWHGVCFRTQGAARTYGLCLLEGGRLGILKKEACHYRELAAVDFLWKHGERVELSVEARGDRIRVFDEAGALLLEYQDTDKPYLNGMIGLCLRKASQCRYHNIKVRPITEN